MQEKLAGLMLLALLLPAMTSAESLKPEEIYQKLLPSVITLTVENAGGETYVGSAFLALDKNVAVTAWHVVSDAVKVSAKFSDGCVLDVTKMIDKDEMHDLALIQIEAGNRPQATLNLGCPCVGSRAYVIGAPKGFEFSITDGLISQIQNIHGLNEYQVSCPISGGNSGGPVVNDRGEVVGIAAWTQKDAQNLSFATPAGVLSRLNPKHAATPWKPVEKASSKPLPSAATQVKTSEPRRDISELKTVLKASAGKNLTITVSDGVSNRKFEVVLPTDFTR